MFLLLILFFHLMEIYCAFTCLGDIQYLKKTEILTSRTLACDAAYPLEGRAGLYWKNNFIGWYTLSVSYIPCSKLNAFYSLLHLILTANL